MPASDPSPAPDVKRLARELRRSVGTFVRAVRTDPAARKSAQSETLGLLDRDGATNVATLAQQRNVKHQTMRLIVAKLEKAALIEPGPDPADRRSRLFAISDAGRAELARGREAREARIAGLIQGSLSDDERATLGASVALLDRLSAAAGFNQP